VLGLRLGDMPSGYTKADGSVVPSGWDIYAAELEAELGSELADVAASEMAPGAGMAEAESEEEEATQLPSGRATAEAAAVARDAAGRGGVSPLGSPRGGDAEEATQRQQHPVFNTWQAERVELQRAGALPPGPEQTRPTSSQERRGLCQAPDTTSA
jgi:hypothetical protein